MKKLATVIAAIALMGSPAFAADMARKMPVMKAPPPPAPAPVYSWTGFYVGGHVGGAFSDDWTSTFIGMFNGQVDPNGFGALPNSFTQKGSGTIAGGQIGYNWQFAPFLVVGAEADLSYLHIQTNSVALPLRLSGVPFNPATCSGPGPSCTTFMTRGLDWLGTIRGRVGVAKDRLLAYVTGGFAYGRVNYSADYEVCCHQFTSFSQTKTGGVIGGGLEYALPGAWGNWILRGEYLFVRLGSDSTTVPQMSPPDPRFAARYDWNQTQIHIARFGLNYKFN
jgi:outer membrane immunogenic protein